MTAEQRADVRRSLEQDEGLRLAAYADHLGYLTIGIGRLIDSRKPGAGITHAEAAHLCDNDIDRCLLDLQGFTWFETLSIIRQNALLNMRFQLGAGGFRRFRKMLAALERGDYAVASLEGLDSTWARVQTPERAHRVMGEVETGQIREERT